MSTTYFNVVAVQGAYLVNGQKDPELSMYRGETYTFEILAYGHPLFITTNSYPYSFVNEYSKGVTDNGTQFGILIFTVPLDAPSTLYYVCQYHSNMGNQINITDQPIPCYSKGTLILTNQGYIKVEDIKKGDIVVREGSISSNGILEKNIDVKEAPIIWISKFTPIILNSNLRPICITKNAFGEECPFVDLYVSPGHRLLINDKLVLSSHLINGETIYQDSECKSVEYYHLVCDIHSAIYANGVLAETYQEWHRDVFDVDN